MNILHLTSVLPAPLIRKKRENDVLLVSAAYMKDIDPCSSHTFIYLIPYSNRILSLFSKRWREYYQLQKKKFYLLEGRKIYVVAVPSFRKDWYFKGGLNFLGFYLNKERLFQLIRENKIDQVHAHNIHIDAGIAYYLKRKLNIPYVVTVRGITSIKLYKHFQKYLKAASSLISINIQHKILAQSLSSKVFLLPHGISKEFLQGKPKDKKDNNGPKRIVSVCRLLDWKNIDNVLLALDKVAYDFQYDIYGEGPDLARLQTILNGLAIKNKVNFLGHIDHLKVSATLRRYDFFVLPSYFETFGRVYIEAMASGLPIICSKNCGMDGYITNGEEGFLIDHKNIDELRDVINRLLTSDEQLQIMSRKAKKFSQEFLWENIAIKLNNIYQSTFL